MSLAKSVESPLDREKRVFRASVHGKIFRYATNFFHDNGFTQLPPVMLGKSVDPLGPDPGSSIVGIPEIEYQGEKLRLTTSMILHKQVAVRDLEKLFIMSPNIRLEADYRKETRQHLFEFTQADFEIAHGKTDDVLLLLERFYEALPQFLKREAAKEFKELGETILEFETPFERHTTHDLNEEYGDEWEQKASLSHEQPFWVLDHAREFYDKEDPDNEGHYLNYDLIYPLGFGEAVSGAEREHEHDRILYRIKRDGLDLSKYEAYLKYSEKGFIPSAGAGIGTERLARFLTKSNHVGDVIMFQRIPGIPIDI